MTSRQKKRWTAVALLLGFCFVCGIIVAWKRSSDSSSQPLPSTVSPEEFQLAKEAFEVAHRRSADRFDALYWLAEQRLARKRPAEAVECFAAIPISHTTYGVMSHFQQGRTLVDLYRAVEAEQQLREVIARDEMSPQIKPEYLIRARQLLRHILEVEIRLEERHQLLRGVIDRGEEQTFEPIVACFPSLVLWNGADAVLWIEHFQRANPDDLVLNVALGRYRTAQGRTKEARQLLETMVQDHPQNLLALAALMECLRDIDDAEELGRIADTLPPRSANDSWLLLRLRGLDALQKGNPEQAAAAYEQLLQQDRTCVEAWQGLGNAARQLNDVPRKIHAFEMSNALARIQHLVTRALQDLSDPGSFLEIADRCAEISLNREGAVMIRCAARLAPANEQVKLAVSQFRQRLIEDHELPLLGK